MQGNTKMKSGIDQLSNLATKIDYESELESKEKNKNVNTNLTSLKTTDDTFTSTFSKEQQDLYLRHAIECCFKQFNMKDYSSIQKYFKGNVVHKYYFDSLEPDIPVRKLKIFVKRFERLTKSNFLIESISKTDPKK